MCGGEWSATARLLDVSYWVAYVRQQGKAITVRKTVLESLLDRRRGCSCFKLLLVLSEDHGVREPAFPVGSP